MVAASFLSSSPFSIITFATNNTNKKKCILQFYGKMDKRTVDEAADFVYQEGTVLVFDKQKAATDYVCSCCLSLFLLEYFPIAIVPDFESL